MKNPRAFTAQLIIGGITVLCAGTLLASGAFAGPTLAEAPQTGAAADLPTADGETPLWAHTNQDTQANLYAAAWKDMNTALQKQDRELFLSHAEGKAKDQLGLWWDNMSAIGFTTGYVDPVGVTTASEISIGVDLGFPANALRGSDTVDAGLVLPFGQQYSVTTQERGDDVVITSFTPAGAPMPWDDGKLYVVKQKHTVIYGLPDERALVDRAAPIAEKAASTLLTYATKLGSKVPQKGFIGAVTDRDERLKRWRGPDSGLTEISGFARSASQPDAATPIMDPAIASGGRVGGSSVVLGPGAMGDGERRFGAVFVHEFTHCLQYSAAPNSNRSHAAAPFEGFARFIEWQTGYSDFAPTPALKDAVATMGEKAFSDDQIRSDATAATGYAAAGSFYRFVAEKGGDPWALAVKSTNDFITLEQLARAQNPKLTAAAWQEWMAGQ